MRKKKIIALLMSVLLLTGVLIPVLSVKPVLAEDATLADYDYEVDKIVDTDSVAVLQDSSGVLKEEESSALAEEVPVVKFSIAFWKNKKSRSDIVKKADLPPHLDNFKIVDEEANEYTFDLTTTISDDILMPELPIGKYTFEYIEFESWSIKQVLGPDGVVIVGNAFEVTEGGRLDIILENNMKLERIKNKDLGCYEAIAGLSDYDAISDEINRIKAQLPKTVTLVLTNGQEVEADYNIVIKNHFIQDKKVGEKSRVWESTVFLPKDVTNPNEVRLLSELYLHLDFVEELSESKVTVRFDENYEGGPVATEVTVAKGNTVDEPVAPTREGYKFAGWFTDKELTVKYDFGTTVTSDLTLYAKWEEIYNVTFHDYTNPDNVETMFVLESVPVVSNGSLSTVPTPVDKEGYVFLGWSSDRISVIPDENILATKITGAVDFYAIYAYKTYTITFDENGGDFKPADQEVEHGKTIGAPTVSREGYKFVRWEDRATGEEFDFTQPITVGHDLIAVWEEKDKLSLDLASISLSTIYVAGSNTPLVFMSNGDIEDFVEFSLAQDENNVDNLIIMRDEGQNLDNADVIYRSGSTYFTLMPKLLERLEPGIYTLTAEYKEGSTIMGGIASASFTVIPNDAPLITPDDSGQPSRPIVAKSIIPRVVVPPTSGLPSQPADGDYLDGAKPISTQPVSQLPRTGQSNPSRYATLSIITGAIALVIVRKRK